MRLRCAAIPETLSLGPCVLCLYLLAPLLATTLCGAPAEEPIDVYVLHSTQRGEGDLVSDPQLLTGIAKRISYCESGLRNAENPNSTASGYFQFLDGTWNWVTGLRGSADDYALETQLEAFYELWDEGEGASHWEPSRYCWELEEPWKHYDR